MVKDKFRSTSEFLKSSGFSKSAYYSWVRGDTLPEMMKVFQIAQLLGVPVSKLFEAENSGKETERISAAYKASREAYEAAARSLRNLSEYFDLPDPTVPGSTSIELEETLGEVF